MAHGQISNAARPSGFHARTSQRRIRGYRDAAFQSIQNAATPLEMVGCKAHARFPPLLVFLRACVAAKRIGRINALLPQVAQVSISRLAGVNAAFEGIST
jgi:hypothetical protein